jgi:hypothetical protein
MSRIVTHSPSQISIPLCRSQKLPFGSNIGVAVRIVQQDFEFIKNSGAFVHLVDHQGAGGVQEKKVHILFRLSQQQIVVEGYLN